MARARKSEQDSTSGAVEARVLVACDFGAPNDVVAITPDEAAAGMDAGQLDTTPESVAYAKTLAQSA